MSKASVKITTVAVRVSPELLAKIQDLLKEVKMSQSNVLHVALELFFDLPKEQQKEKLKEFIFGK